MISHWKHRNSDYTHDLVLLTNTYAQAESLLHSLEQAALCIGLNVNVEFMCFWRISGIRWLVHLYRQQYPIYWNRCQHTHIKGEDCYDNCIFCRNLIAEEIKQVLLYIYIYIYIYILSRWIFNEVNFTEEMRFGHLVNK